VLLQMFVDSPLYDLSLNVITKEILRAHLAFLKHGATGFLKEDFLTNQYL
jgi:hypothetical protein